MAISDTMLSTLSMIPWHTVADHFGLVSWSTVRTKHLGKDIFAGIKNMFGGELTSYTELLEEARNESIGRMIGQAEELGANAIVNIRMATSSVTTWASEVYVYGTAVRVEKA